MTDTERLLEITERHLNRPKLDGTPWCTYCSQRYPCDVKVALAEVERLRGVVEAALLPARNVCSALEAGHLGVAGLAAWSTVAELAGLAAWSALAELEGKG